jgi:hypothetical protein
MGVQSDGSGFVRSGSTCRRNQTGCIEPSLVRSGRFKPWIEAAKKRLHHNVRAIALANKLARIAWSVLARGRAFEVRKMDEAAN